ncbi:MAG: sugar-binding domain-containing protein [Armatimonadota bacterium]
MKNTLSLNGSWQLCQSDKSSDTIIAQLPGEVEEDLVQAGKIPEPHFGMNAEQTRWVGEKLWLYRRKFIADEDFLQRQTYLEFDGLSAPAAVTLNGHEVGQAQGGLIPRKLDVTDAIKVGNNTIEILFEPGTGICRDIRLVSCDLVSIDNIHIETEIEGCRANAWIYIEVANHTQEDVHVAASVVVSKGENRENIEVDDYISPFGGVIEAVIRIEEPEPWWPNGMGEASLYNCMVGIACDGEVQDVTQTTFGVRDISFVGPGGGQFPTLLANGEKVFAKGADWTNVTHSSGECYRELALLAKDANINLLMIGDNEMEGSAFYQACDETGIMICQSLPSADKGEDIKVVLKSLRNHPSVVAWVCDENAANQKVLSKFDHARPVISNLTFVDNIQVSGPPEMDSLRKFIPEDQLFPPDSETMIYHGSSTDMIELTRQKMGEFKSPEQFTAYAGILQGEMLKADIECRRREKSESTSALLGVFNDSRPEISNSLVDSYLRPKPAYYYVKRAFESVIISFRQVDDRVQIYVTTDDRLHGIDGNLKLGVMTFDACGLDTWEVPVKIEANSSAVVWQSDLLDKIFTDAAKQCLVAMLEVSEDIIARDVYFARPWSQINFPLPKLLVHREQLSETTHELVISVDSFARNIAVSNLPPQARPSDNYFDVLPGEQKTVIIRNIAVEQANDIKLNVWGR